MTESWTIGIGNPRATGWPSVLACAVLARRGRSVRDIPAVSLAVNMRLDLQGAMAAGGRCPAPFITLLAAMGVRQCRHGLCIASICGLVVIRATRCPLIGGVPLQHPKVTGLMLIA